MGNFEKACEKIRTEKPNMLDSVIKEEVKSKILCDFAQFTLEVGRQIVKQSGVLLLLEWDIENAIVFDSVRK